MTKERLRFAPSPTGYLHVGGARTALFNWLLARRVGGTFILRIEDTDVARSTQESVDAILEGMSWLGLDWDEGPFYQSDNFPLYRRYAEQLLAAGKAYRCYCTAEELEEKREKAMASGQKPKYDGTCRHRAPQDDQRPHVIRFRAPQEGVTAFNDLIKGSISFSNDEMDDLIIVRTDGTPTYNFVVVVDDAAMKITTVIRGDDHINNTPRQIMLYEALGFPVPRFAHVPMILGADKTRLSKRHGATSVIAYRDMGYLPEAMVNYLVRLGWSHGDDEIFTRDELVNLFSIENVGRSASVFNPDKLLWLNAHYIKTGDPERLAGILKDQLALLGVDTTAGPSMPAVVKTLQERARTMVEMAEGAQFYFRAVQEYDEKGLAKLREEGVLQLLEELTALLSKVEPFSYQQLEESVKGYCADKGLKLGQVGPVIRVALCGSTAAPGVHEVMEVLGKEATLERLRQAGEFLKRQA